MVACLKSTILTSDETPMTLQIDDLQFGYAGSGGFHLRVPSLTLEAGTTCLLLGPSGSGKSTFLGLLAGVLTPERGRIALAGQDMSQLSGARMDKFRGLHIGFIYQTLNLIPWLSTRENIALGLAFAPQRRARLSAGVADTITDFMTRLDLDAGTLGDQPAGLLSLGQQQRVAAARALVGAPDLVLADEPSSALDVVNTEKFFDLLMAGLDRQRQVLLVVSHDARLAPRFDRVINMADLTGAPKMGDMSR
ncbi:MAG TPA: methionine ABC transporter ATP-binding protein [Rhodobiaceae bacterium]|nr:methionine ABC transporter ATP-binding protein [Rhodobiaceae bacterium]